jgi:hypothetical protein
MTFAAGLFAGCDHPASYVPTPDPSSTPTKDVKEANWKIIEGMRKGLAQATPTPTPTVVPHGDNKKNYKEPAIVKRAQLVATPSITSRRLLQEEHKQGLDRMQLAQTAAFKKASADLLAPGGSQQAAPVSCTGARAGIAQPDHRRELSRLCRSLGWRRLPPRSGALPIASFWARSSGVN